MNKLSFTEASIFLLHGLHRILTIGIFSLLVMSPPDDRLHPTEPNSELDGLARRYKALMSLMD